MDYRVVISTIDLDNDFPHDITEDEIQPGHFQFFVLDGSNKRQQLQTIEEIMKIPAHPNIPRMTARAVDVESPRYVVLKDVGVRFSDVKDTLTCSERSDVMVQLEWAIEHLHNHNVAHRNISTENLRVKRQGIDSASCLSIQLIGLQDAKLNADENDLIEDKKDLDKLRKLLNICTNEDQKYSIDIVEFGERKTFDYNTGQEVMPKDHQMYLSRGTFTSINIDGLTQDEIYGLTVISTHAMFPTIFAWNIVGYMMENKLLQEYYPDAVSLQQVIHGSEDYSTRDAFKWIDQLTQGVQFLGDLNLLHGAICPENIIKISDRLKITGVENICKLTRDTRLFYLDPKNIPFNKKICLRTADEHSLRVVMREILTRQHPSEIFPYDTPEDMIVSVKDDKNLFAQYVPSTLGSNTDHFEDLQRLACACDQAVQRDSRNLSMYHLGLVLRSFDILPQSDIMIGLPTKSHSLTNDAPFQIWPLIEADKQDEQENKAVGFIQSTGDHFRLEPASPLFDPLNPNKATFRSRSSCTKCFSKPYSCHPVVSMNRTLDFGETIKLSIVNLFDRYPPQSTRINISFSLDSENLQQPQDAGLASPSFSESTVMVFRLTDKLVCVYQINDEGVHSDPKYMNADMNSVLQLMCVGYIRNVTISHAEKHDVIGEYLVENTQFKPKMLRISPLKLDPELDLFLAHKSELLDANSSHIIIRQDKSLREMTVKTVEYCGNRYCYWGEDDLSSFNLVDAWQQLHSVFDLPQSLALFEDSSVLLNIRGLVRNEDGVTGALMDHVVGNLWDDVIMNNQYKYNLRQIYVWIKQLTDALRLIVDRVYNFEFNSKFIFVTEDGNLKLFCSGLIENTFYHTELQRTRFRAPYNPRDTLHSRTVFTIGTIIWDLIHRSSSLSFPDLDNLPIDDAAGDACLRNLIRQCWSPVPRKRPTHSAILEQILEKLTETDLSFQDVRDFQMLSGSISSERIELIDVTSRRFGKTVYKRYLNTCYSKFRKQEVEVFRKTKGITNFPKCYGIVGSYENIQGILIEKMFGTLDDKVILNKHITYGPFEVCSWSLQISSAMMYLHSLNLIHRDIRPSNILIDNRYQCVKLSGLLFLGSTVPVEDIGGPRYFLTSQAAEEHFESVRYTPMADVYSFGVTLYQLVQRPTFQSSESTSISIDPGSDTAQLSFFIERCCKRNPNERPQIKDIVRFFDKRKQHFESQRMTFIDTDKEDEDVTFNDMSHANVEDDHTIDHYTIINNDHDHAHCENVSFRSSIWEQDPGFKSEIVDFRTMDYINNGTFAVIYNAEITGDAVPRNAVYKMFKERLMSQEDRRKEVEMFRMGIGHNFIPKLYGIVGDPTYIKGVLIESMLGDMYKHVITANLEYGACEMSRWGLQVSCALNFLHGRNIVHTDIKPENILIAKDYMRALLSDFGTVASTVKSGWSPGTLNYTAPEIIEMESLRYNPKVDVYAFGVVLYQLVQRVNVQLRRDMDFTVDPKKDVANLGPFIKRCGSRNPHRRPLAWEIMYYFNDKMKEFKDQPMIQIPEEEGDAIQ